jgi:hypothetical protein
MAVRLSLGYGIVAQLVLIKKAAHNEMHLVSYAMHGCSYMAVAEANSSATAFKHRCRSC